MIYKYKGKKYLLIDDTHTQMKDPKTGLWVEAVAYVKDPVGQKKIDTESLTFVRMKSDFEHKFEKC